MTATPAARRLLDTLAKPHATLTGERTGSSDTLRYVLRESDAHGEILRTTYLPSALIAGMVKSKALTVKEGKKLGLSLLLNYAVAKI